MSKTAVPTSTDRPGAAAPPAPGPKKPSRAGQVLKKVLTPLASLRLTVVLFLLAIFIVFCGTLAQRYAGIWTVLHQYFRCLLVWIPWQIFFPDNMRVPGTFPFPGGWLIGGLLLLNLLAAHAIRFKITWKRSGILLIHAGLIVMMVSELVTGLAAVEGSMTIEQGQASNFVEQHDAAELAVIDPSDAKVDDVVAVPDSFLKKGGVIRDKALPFDVVVDQYLPNSEQPKPRNPSDASPVTAGDGLAMTAVPAPEVSGTDPDQKVDLPSAYLTFKDKDSGKALGTYMVSLWFSPPLSERPQQVTVNGKTYDVFLRFKRTYKPYTIRLKEFRHTRYQGTDVPKDFSSIIQLVDRTQNEDREVRIWMNHPLRYAGETFYQSGFLPEDKGTILQVVHNPGWLMPYLSCLMVSLGMVVHFGLHLLGFLRRRVAA